MLVLTLKEGESALAVGRFELFYNGRDSVPMFDLVTTSDMSFTIQLPSGTEIEQSSDAMLKRPIDLYLGGELRIGECRIELQPWTLGRMKVCIEAPLSVVFRRPAQHGGSLLVRA